jgi:hypothetical protein
MKITNNLIKTSKKLKFKYPPISELVNRVPKILKIKNVYELKDDFENFFLVHTKNYSKEQRERYFLTIVLANQSSDYLVNIARNLPTFDQDYKLIQYPLYPQYHRIGLLLLYEIQREEDISTSMTLLKSFKKSFRKRIEKP